MTKQSINHAIEKAGTRVASALLRALWTFCEAMLAQLVLGTRIETFDWIQIISVSATAALISFLKTILVGSPESDGDMDYGTLVIDDSDTNSPRVAFESDQPGLPNPDVVKRIVVKVDRGVVSDPSDSMNTSLHQ